MNFFALMGAITARFIVPVPIFLDRFRSPQTSR